MEDGVAPFFYVVHEQKSAQHGRNKQSEQQRTQKSERDRPGHGTEQAPFHALQSEDRKVRNDDDNAGEENRLLNFVGRGGDHLGECLLAAAKLGVTQDVFHHHHRTIHHHAEVERSQRKQVGGNVIQVQQDRRK